MDCARIAVAILAAGQSKRFGSNKLLADLGGVPLGLHIVKAAEQLRFGWRFAICGKNALIEKQFTKAGFVVIENRSPEHGQSHSLHLAVRAAEPTEAAALLILLADMPFVPASHIAAVIAYDAMVASTDGRKPMPPALFPRAYWPDLLKTKGDSGARDLLAGATLVSAAASQLRDIDLAADMPKPQE